MLSKEAEKIRGKELEERCVNNNLEIKEKKHAEEDEFELKYESTEEESGEEKVPVGTPPEWSKSYSQRLNMLVEKRKALQVPFSYSSDEDEMETLNAKLKESSAKINQLEANYESALRERNEIHEELELAEHKIAETRALLHETEDVNFETQDRVETLTSELRKYKANMKSTTKQIARFEAALEEERLKVAELSRELARARLRSVEVQKKAERDKKESAIKDKTIDELKASLEHYNAKTESLLNAMSNLQAQIFRSEKQKKELEHRVCTAEKKAHEATTDSEQIVEENQKLNLEIEGFYVRLSEMQALYNECQSERTDFECQAMALQQKVTKLESDLVEAKCARLKRMTKAVALQNMSVIERATLFLRSKFVSAFHGVFSF